MRPIPRAMLVHTVTLAQAPEGAFQSEAPATVAVLTRVRVEPVAAIAFTKDNTQVSLTALLVYDTRHSLPAGITFAVGQSVTFEGKLYRVETVNRLFDGRRLHHIEAGLSG